MKTCMSGYVFAYNKFDIYLNLEVILAFPGTMEEFQKVKKIVLLISIFVM